MIMLCFGQGWQVGQSLEQLGAASTRKLHLVFYLFGDTVDAILGQPPPNMTCSGELNRDFE
jgi:hypothetical protein